MRETIEITVTPAGQTTVQTKGFIGATCREASRFLEQALGRQTSESPTAEFHKTTMAGRDQMQQRS